MNRLFLLGTVIALLISCQKENADLSDNNLNGDENNYIPLNVGNYWVYKII
ncbi:MAG: hypothetical protein JW894_04505 [Bacteroidales bacterium]|nr:hypothetical protein [Bacteroidales bacterium]